MAKLAIHRIKLRVVANPIGSVTFAYLLEVKANELRKVGHVAIPCPGYAYRHPTFLGFHVPVSSIAHPIKASLVDSHLRVAGGEKDVDMEPVLSREVQGHHVIRIDVPGKELPEDSNTVYIGASVELSDYVERDRVFFSFALPLTIPRDSVARKINVSCESHFAIGIRSHRVYAFWYDADTGRRRRHERIESYRDGDVIRFSWRGTDFGGSDELDICVEGSRIPGVAVPRRVFWSACYIIAASVAVYSFLRAILGD